MAGPGRILPPIIVGLFLLCISSVVGQLSPEFEKLWKLKKQEEIGLSEFKKFIAEQGQDYKDGVALLRNKAELFKALESKLSEMLSNGLASVHENGPDDDYYALNVQREDRNVTLMVSSTCLDHVRMVFWDTIKGEDYALRMQGAAGEPPAEGVYTGQGKDPGNMWLCTSNKMNETGYPPFNGKYCYSDIPYTGIGWGECWPDTCTASDATAISLFIWWVILRTPMYLYHECQEPYPWNSADIGFAATLAFFGLLVACGTFYDIYLQGYVLNRMRRNIRGSLATNEKKKNNETVTLTEVQEVTMNVYENPGAMLGEDADSGVATSSAADGDGSLHSASEVTECGEPNKVTTDLDKMTGVGGISTKCQDGSNENTEHISSVHWDKGITLTNDDSQKPSGHLPSYQTFSVTAGGSEDEQNKQKGHLGWAILHATLMSFSAVNNCRKLLSAKKTKNTMAVLNGLRVLSMWWVILGHSALFYIGRVLNPYQGLGYFDKYGSLAISNATYSVDTFFVLSGFLVTYLSLKQIDSGRLKSAGSWVIFYFHRWWRLTPVYMVAMGIWALLFPHFGQGFLTNGLYEYVKHFCRRQWWTHPIYINNLYPWPNVVDDSCMGWSWYLANDMQFYIISPLILIILYKNGKAGMALISSIMLVSLGSLFGINWYYGYTINGDKPYNDHVPDPENADTAYAKPYTRIPTYLVGMILGYIMFKLQGKKIKMNPMIVFLGWSAASIILWSVLYGPWYPYGKPTPQIVSVMYLTFSRLAWGVGIAWIIFACLLGYGGPIGVLLDWNFWTPLGRLTYCAYLIHPVIIYTKIYTDEVLFQATYVSLSYFYVGNIVFTYASSLILSLLIEGPFIGLEKVILGKVQRS